MDTNEPRIWRCDECPAEFTSAEERQKHVHQFSIGDDIKHIQYEFNLLRKEYEDMQKLLKQVDDVLIVNWITVKDNDYKKALADLVTTNIAQHDDPVLNPPITGVAMRHRETKEVFSLPKPARHDSLIRALVDQGKPDFAKGEQGFITEDGRFLDREEAFVHAARFGQLKSRILFSEDLW